jgi:signal peptidase I
LKKNLDEKLKDTLKLDVHNKVIMTILNFIEALLTAFVLVFIIQKFYLGNFLVPTESMYPTIKPKDRVFGNMVVYHFFDPERDDIVVFKEPIKDRVLFTKRVMGLPGEEVEIKGDSLYINQVKYEGRSYIPIDKIAGKVWRIPEKGDIVTIKSNIEEFEKLAEGNLDVENIQKKLKENKLDITQIPRVHFFIEGKETGMLTDLLHYEEILTPLLEGKEVTLKLKQDYYFMLGDNTEGSLDSRVWGFVARDRIKGKPFFKFWPIKSFGRIY